ncbi:MAG: FKBP-type peptidyl-prolyl cis-trans isomerase [Erythrobacter sp.]|nr:FKBP-type peptidyl-prolyl cis-trans isomerase [Erythrobacter sp.]
MLTACQEPATEAPEEQPLSLETTEARLSYGVALRMGQRMKADGMVVDVDAYAAGLRDAMEENEPKLTEEDIQAEMIAFQERAQAEQAAAREAVATENAEQGAAYLAENATKEGVIVTESGLQYEVVEAGEGANPTTDDSVEVHYEGTLIDGTVFDSSIQRGQTVTFGVTQVIPGWTEALQLMKPGAKFKLHIPPELAYGAGGAGNLIGPNATLGFDVELVSIVGAEAPAEAEAATE